MSPRHLGPLLVLMRFLDTWFWAYLSMAALFSLFRLLMAVYLRRSTRKKFQMNDCQLLTHGINLRASRSKLLVFLDSTLGHNR